MQGHKRYKKSFEVEINNLRVQILAGKWCNFTWKFCLSLASSPHRINSLVQFSVQCIHIKRIFKMVSHFFLLLCSFWEISKSVAPRVIVQWHLKRMLKILKDLQIIRKKPDTGLISIHLSCTDENFKVMLWCVWDLGLAKYKTLQPFEEIRQKLHKTIFDVLLFGFWPV